MSQQQLQCEQAAKNAYVAAMAEVSLFCKILGYPDSQANYLIGGDPHGLVDIMEGYRIFNMTDIHVVLSEYERWLSIYKTNEELRKAVDAWYYYCQEWYEKHSYEEPRWVSVDERLPAHHVPIIFSSGPNTKAYGGWYDEETKEFTTMVPTGEMWYITSVRQWHYQLPCKDQEAERSKGCPNLRSWLAGCPVDGLREATPEWKEEQRKEQETAHQRVEEAKKALEDAIKEEVKLNKF